MSKLEKAILNQMVGQEVTYNCKVCDEKVKMVITENKKLKCKKCGSEYDYEIKLDEAAKGLEKMGVFVGR